MKKSFIRVALALFIALFITFTFGCSTPIDEPSSEETKTEQQEEKKTENPPSEGSPSGGTSQGGGSSPTGGTNGGGQTPQTPESGTPQPPAPVINYTVTFMSNCETATGTTNSITAAENTNITLTANGFIREGYTFTGWNTAADGTGTGYAESSTIKLTGNLILYAQWILATVPTYEVRLFDDNNWGTLSQNNATAGTEITLTFKIPHLYHVWSVYVSGWIYDTVNGVYRVPSIEVHQDVEKPYIYTFIMPDHDVTVTYQYNSWSPPEYTHELSTSCENGYFSSLFSTYSYGNEVSFTVQPAYGCVFDSISIIQEDGTEVDTTVSQSNVYYFIMPNQNVTITANCRAIGHRISVLPVSNGTVSVNTSRYFLENDRVSFSVIPNTDYIVRSVTVKKADGSTIVYSGEIISNRSSNCNLSFNMPDQEVIIDVSIESGVHSIHINSAEHGYSSTKLSESDTASEVTAACVGKTVYIYNYPDEFYVRRTLRVVDENNNRIDVSYGNYHAKFTMPDSEVTITTSFYLPEYTVKFSSINFKSPVVVNVQSGTILTSPFEISPEDGGPEIDNEVNCEGFLGWCYYSSVYDLNSEPVTRDMELRAKWNRITLTKEEFVVHSLGDAREYKIVGNLDNKYNWNFSNNYDNSYYYGEGYILNLSEVGGVLREGEFENLQHLTKVILPEGMSLNEKSIFKNCISLQSINIPGTGNGYIAEKVFENCTSLSSITIPNGIWYIDSNAFEGCVSLKNVTFEDTESKWKIYYQYYVGDGAPAPIAEIGPMSATDLQNNAKLLIETYKDYEWVKQ